MERRQDTNSVDPFSGEKYMYIFIIWTCHFMLTAISFQKELLFAMSTFHVTSEVLRLQYVQYSSSKGSHIRDWGLIKALFFVFYQVSKWFVRLFLCRISVNITRIIDSLCSLFSYVGLVELEFVC